MTGGKATTKTHYVRLSYIKLRNNLIKIHKTCTMYDIIIYHSAGLYKVIFLLNFTVQELYRITAHKVYHN